MVKLAHVTPYATNHSYRHKCVSAQRSIANSSWLIWLVQSALGKADIVPSPFYPDFLKNDLLKNVTLNHKGIWR